MTTQTEAERRAEEEAAIIESGGILPPEVTILPDPPPSPEEPETFESLPNIITQEDVTQAIESGGVVDPRFIEPTKEINIGIKTQAPDKITDPVVIQNLKSIQTGNQELFRVLVEQGIEAFNKAVVNFNQKQAIIQQKQKQEVALSEFEFKKFKEKHTRIPDDDNKPENDRWIRNEDLAEIKKEDPKLHEILTTKGEKAALKYIETLEGEAKIILANEAEVQAQIEIQDKALAKLDDYKEETHGGTEYKIAQFLFDSVLNNPSIVSENTSLLQIAEQTLREAGFSEKDIQNARVDAFSEQSGKIETVKPEDFKPPNWIRKGVTNLENWYQNLAVDLEKSNQEVLKEQPFPVKLALTGGSGLLLTGATIATALPILIGRAVINPAGAPAMIVDTGKQMVGHAVGTVTKLGTGFYEASVKTGDASLLVYDTAMTYLIVKGGTSIAKPIVSKVTTYVAPRGVPASLIAKEVSTGRIKGGSSSSFVARLAETMAEVERLASTKGGNFTGDVPIKGTPYKLRYLKTAIQDKIGNILWHGTKTEVDAAGVVTKPSLLEIAEQGAVTVGEGGLYTSPWAAIGFSRGGQNPGLMMIITDTAKIKSGAKGFKSGATQSDAFIRNAPEGLYGPSKVWRGDIETEVLIAPGGKLITPPAKASLLNRVLAGNSADFFTYDAGKFVPIKVAFDSSLLKAGELRAPTPIELYAIKLLTLKNALRDTSQAIRHPGAALKDIAGTAKAMADLDGFVRGSGGKGGQITTPGVRNVYLLTDWKVRINELILDLYNRAFNRTKNRTKAEPTTKEFNRIFEQELQAVYESNARALANQYREAVSNYSKSEIVRSKFEASYLSTLGISLESLAKTSRIESTALSEIFSDARRTLPRSMKITSPNSLSARSIISPFSRPSTTTTSSVTSTGTTKTSRIKTSALSSLSSLSPISTRAVRTERTTPRSITTVRTITTRTPRTPETPKRPIIPLLPSSGDETERKKKKKKQWPITFWHGRIRGWITIFPPYDKTAKIEATRKRPKGAKYDKGGIKTAFRTIQSLGGDVNVLLRIDSGNQDITIKNPSRKPGKPGAIDFELDRGNKTKNVLTLKGVRIKK